MSKSERPYIFIDTCSLLDSCWNRETSQSKCERFVYSKEKEETFWGAQFQSLCAMGDVIIPKRNYEELVKHSKSVAKKDLAARARYTLQKINSLCKDGKIMIVGDENDPFADAILLAVALKFKTQKNMAFITQDRKLSEDLEAIRHFRSVDNRAGYDIKIRRISEEGILEPHRGLGEEGAAQRHRNPERNDEPKIEAKPTRSWWES